MSLVINNNMMAANASRALNGTYGRLGTSIQRLSTGLRVNSAADDAAGLAIREMMRADITATQQGIRNAADAISMIQTADGALGVIDEKLTRMKELAEQAATGTYTTVQRDIINSEYQAMAAEIDRIANATNFNGIKLLDGSVSNQHGGQGVKIHFGTSNNAAEDYYFINIGDARATSATGLRVGGDAKNDVWAQGAAAADALGGPGCCTGGFESLNGRAGFIEGQGFSYGYNWDWREIDEETLLSPRYLAGRYTVGYEDSLQDLIDKVNQGTQSRAGIKIDDETLGQALSAGGLTAICFGDEAYVYGSAMTIIKNPGGTTFSTTQVLAEVTYNPRLAYTNLIASDSTLVFTQPADPTLTAALSRLGLTKTEVPGSYIAQEINDELVGYIQDYNTPGFEAKRDTYIENNWADEAARWEIGGVDRDPNGVIENFLSSLTVPDEFFDPDTGAIISADNSFEVNLDIYGDFTDLDSPKGVYTADAGLAALFGFTTPLKITFATEKVATAAGQPDQVQLKVSVNDTLLETYGPQDGLHQDYFEFAFRNALGRAVFDTGAYELTEQNAYNGPPDVNPRDLEVTLHTMDPGITVCDKDITIMEREADGRFTAAGLASAVNNNADSDFWAMVDRDDSDILYLFAKEGGDNNHLVVSELGPESTMEFRNRNKHIINQLDLGIQDLTAVRVNDGALMQTIGHGGLTAISFGNEAYVYGEGDISLTGGSTLTVSERLAEVLYDPKLSYLNIGGAGGSTLVFRSPDADLLAALSSLGLDEPKVLPGSQIAGQEVGSRNEAQIQYDAGNRNYFQNELNSHIQAANWAASRRAVGGVDHDPTDVVNELFNAAQAQLNGAPATFDSANTTDTMNMTLPPLYIDMDKGIYTKSAELANLLGLEQLEITLTAERVAQAGVDDVQITYSINGTTVLPPSAGPAETLSNDDLKAAYRTALTSVFSNGAYELTSQSYNPTVNQNEIEVKAYTVEHQVELDAQNVTIVPRGGGFTAGALADAVNNNAGSRFQALARDDGTDVIYLLPKVDTSAELDPEDEVTKRMLRSFSFQNVETGEWDDEAANFTLGGEAWARLTPRQSRANKGAEVWNVALAGRDVGAGRDLRIAGANDQITPGLAGSINGLDGESFYELQNAADAPWAGAEVRSQSSAQEALDALSQAITNKDKMRANLGALQNRLENTMTNLEIQAEALAASESRISDVDVAKEMTAFTRNNVLTQAAVGMLSQANSMSQLALSLLG